MNALSLTASAAVSLAACCAARADVLLDTFPATFPLYPVFLTPSTEFSPANATYTSIYTAQPISVSAAAGSHWHVTELQFAFGTNTTGGATVPSAGTGRLYIFPRSGALPAATDMPQAGGLHAFAYAPVPAIGSLHPGLVTVGGLDLDLTPGDYWIGFAPIDDPAGGAVVWKMLGTAVPIETLATLPASITPAGVGGNWASAMVTPDSGFQSANLNLRMSGSVVPLPGAAGTLAIGAALVGSRRRRPVA